MKKLNMLKQTRFCLGLILIVEAISCFFLVICFLFRDKKNTAGPFTLLGILSGVAGGFMVAEKVKEHFEEELFFEKLAKDTDNDEAAFAREIPVDETADEAEFNA